MKVKVTDEAVLKIVSQAEARKEKEAEKETGAVVKKKAKKDDHSKQLKNIRFSTPFNELIGTLVS